MADQIQEYTVSHTGGVLGEDMVTLEQNDTGREDTILRFECPRKFKHISYVGQRDATRFVPRALETITGTANDDTVVSLSADIQAIAGETELSEQDYPAVVAYNVTQGVEVDISDVDYSANEVTLATDPADGDTVKLYPIIAQGQVQFQAINQFEQVEGPIYPWPTPIYRWHDFKQLKRGREINLHGSVEWTRYEALEVLLDSPEQIVWTDPDYPRGEYVSTFEQDVNIAL